MMKSSFILLFFFACCSLQGFCQDTVFLKNNKYSSQVTDRAPQAVYAELWGKSLIFSANYDRRFSKRLDGLGFCVGAGFIKVDRVSLFSFPVGLNYLLGKNGKYFEVGAGASYFSASINDIGDASDHGSTIIGTMTIGYRSQPVKGGFMFRAGLNPLIFKNNFIPYWPYISVGYNF